MWHGLTPFGNIFLKIFYKKVRHVSIFGFFSDVFSYFFGKFIEGLDYGYYFIILLMLFFQKQYL